MKINKKVIIPSLTICMGAALVGSISGTVAWYQYSTRTQASMAAVTAGANKNLEISLDGTNWKADLSTADLKAWLEDTAKNTHSDGTALTPVTSGAFTKDSAAPSKFYLNPIYQHAAMTSWGEAEATDFIQIPLQVRYHENNGTEDSYPEKDVYLNDVTIANKTVEGKQDISDAVRVHVAGAETKLFANVATTDTNGKLDLNGDGALDREKRYDFQEETEEIVYGEGTQTSYDATSDDAPFADDTDPKEVVTTDAMKVGTSSSAAGFTVTLTIWLEGWQKLDVTKGETITKEAIWSTDYIGSAFNVGIRFCCQAD